ncbi:MAG: InlB B-repeat-containing protein [Clostridia bacterium]|nr:InlB B-repeat-containing protein [Clostridia bacterium]
MKKFKVMQATVAAAMAVSMFSFTACDLFGGGNDQNGDGNTYEVKLNANEGDVSFTLSEYVSGEVTSLPNAEKAHYDFNGWYADSQFSGKEVYSIPKSSKGNVEYWAKWTPKTYSIKYHIDGTEYTESTVTSYTYNVATQLPQPEKANHALDGWYKNSDYSGETVGSIAKGEYGNKEYYAKWNADAYNVTLNLDGGELATNLTSYTYGKGATLPTPEKDGYRFDGWFTQANGGGTKVESITKTDTGDKTFYAKWTLTAAIDVKASGGYEEGAFIEINTTDKVNISNIKVSYKLSTVNTFTQIDDALIREVTKDGKTYVRADIVGISAGTYSIKVSAGGSDVVKNNIAVTAYDRSGYAHFGKTDGVGAYKDDGTPKNNAKIIYVTEATKNTVTAKLGSKTYTGIGNILTNVKDSSDPVIIRIIGRVAAATWNQIDYSPNGEYNQKNKLPASKVKGINGNQLPTSANDLTQQALIDGGYNTLDTTKYSILNGLSSKASYSSNAYDSCWNDCSISAGAEDVTVEGIGTDAEIFQWGMTWKSANSIEVRNLTFDDYTEDACSFEGATDSTNFTGKTPDKFNSKNLWIHHCTFNEGKNYWDVSDEQDKHEGDGATDFKRCSYVTTSYNCYYKNHKTGLVGSDDSVFTSSITFHHNYYNICASRLPLARVANMHMYNNYYFGSTGTNMSLRSGAYAFIEYCYFENANGPIQTQVGTKKPDGQSSFLNGCAKVYKCEFVGKQVDTSAYNVTILTKDSDRTKAVDNDNIYAKDFDTNTQYFYYDSVNKCSKVTNLITDLSLVKSQIPNLAGVHKK